MNKAKQKTQQFKFHGREFKRQLFFGGSLTSKRAHRVARPLSTKDPIHLILKSKHARGERSFWKKAHAQYINQTLRRLAAKWGIKVYNCVNVGNHLHLHIQLKNLKTYTPFIRAFTGALSLRIGGDLYTDEHSKLGSAKFWDFRPYTRVVVGLKGLMKLKDYLLINELEGMGSSRIEAKFLLEDLKTGPPLRPRWSAAR